MSVGVYYNKPHNDLFQTNPTLPYKRDVQKVKRQLFGPVDHEEAHRYVAQELEKHYTLKSERWNFDFKNERTLNSNGIYDWRPTTPVKFAKPIKRRPSNDIEFDNHELYCLPDDICRPKPVKPALSQDQTSPKNGNKMQSLITDFMQIKKVGTETSKKMSRPSKIPRLGNELLRS